MHGRRGAVSAEIRRLAHRAPRAALGHTPDPRWLPPVFQWELVHVGGREGGSWCAQAGSSSVGRRSRRASRHIAPPAPRSQAARKAQFPPKNVTGSPRWRCQNSNEKIGAADLKLHLQRRHTGSDNEERRPLPHYFSGEITGEERTGELQLFFMGLGKRRQG